MKNENGSMNQYRISLGPILIINKDLCTGCNSCVKVCRQHILMPAPVKKAPPQIINIEECWLCGSCCLSCEEEAIKMVHPLVQRVGWKRKDTEQYFRIGANTP